MVSRDGMRFSYIVWIDEESKLPLRVDLLDRDGGTLEQFRVIAFDVGQQVANEMRSFSRLTLPPLLRLPPAEHVSFNWRTTWVPDGFKEVSRSRRTLPSCPNPLSPACTAMGCSAFPSTSVRQPATAATISSCVRAANHSYRNPQ